MINLTTMTNQKLYRGPRYCYKTPRIDIFPFYCRFLVVRRVPPSPIFFILARSRTPLCGVTVCIFLPAEYEYCANFGIPVVMVFSLFYPEYCTNAVIYAQEGGNTENRSVDCVWSMCYAGSSFSCVIKSMAKVLETTKRNMKIHLRGEDLACVAQKMDRDW